MSSPLFEGKGDLLEAGAHQASVKSHCSTPFKKGGEIGPILPPCKKQEPRKKGMKKTIGTPNMH